MKLKINEDQYTDAAGWDDHVFKVPYLQLYGNRFNTRVKDNKLSTVGKLSRNTRWRSPHGSYQ